MGWFASYGASDTRDTGTPQTDCYFGLEGACEHGHVAFDHDGNFRFRTRRRRIGDYG